MAAATGPNFTAGVPVPAVLWDAFEDTLRANMRRLAKDIAKTLGQSEMPLFDALFKGPGATVKPYVFEEAAAPEIDMRCEFLCQMPESCGVWQTCGQPVVWLGGVAKRCTEHLYAGPVPALAPHMLRLVALEPEALDASDGFLAASEDGTVYDKTGAVRGRYSFVTKKLMLLEPPA
jgi:hypothetical protein